MAAKLGQLLINNNIITEEQLNKATELQKKEGGRIGSNLIKLGYLTEESLVEFLSKQYGVSAVALSTEDIDPSIIKFVPYDVAHKYQIFPISKNGASLKLAMTDPSNVFAIDDVKFMTGYEVEPVVASESAIKEAISRYYEQSDDLQSVVESMADFDEESLDLIQDTEDDIDMTELKSAVEEAPVVKLVNLILSEAIVKGASDIHLEPYEKTFRIRYRIDGMLYDVMQPPIRLKAALSSRLKIMAELDIAERRLPQDGRIKLKIRDRGVDLRVSTLPTLFGEKIVMRILDKSNLNLDLTKLGFEENALKDFEEAIRSPFGMVLVTGPTGSGKTTTLYSALSTVNEVDVNIMTAEDPVEYNLLGINQVHVREDIGLTFAAALRSFLRQDPDIVMVGEIRDLETAEIAVKAALTGHLVLSTLHTNDAPSTISRLLNMGIEPFLVSASVVLILAQRLCRKVCEECREEDKVPEPALIKMGFTKDEAESIKCYRGKGCPACSETGYKGRIALYEVMPVKEEIKEMIIKGATGAELKKTAINSGMQTLRRSGLIKIKEGLTSVQEIMRVTFGD
ncbi:MAG TPA: type IV-A pilus assembly ATPase PilB [Nitrospirae bacterium]|nr:type II secretion system protein E [bacterium BMS3Abin06]HDH12114.1 type IV-A pilus assembly ATPase PilB [Nitrospirota bacterium]HDZ02380.1 type IV-A pilus assembly ATPase PilB [Nitrospirota bacterium]